MKKIQIIAIWVIL